MSRRRWSTPRTITLGVLIVFVAAAGWISLSAIRPHPAGPTRGSGLAPPIPEPEPAGPNLTPPAPAGDTRRHGTAPVRLTERGELAARAPASPSLPATAPPSTGAPGGTRAAGGRSAWPNVRVDSAVSSPEETAIAIDPANPNRIVAVAQGSGCYHFHSVDGGATWTEGLISDPYDLGDPTLAMDANGVAFYGYIGKWTHSGIFVARSMDGGATWQPGVPVIEHEGATPFEDKEYPACDRTNGPYGGSLYVAWTQFDTYGSPIPADSSRVLFSYSRDQGITFAPPTRVSDRGGNCVDGDDTVEGAVPSVDLDGTVYLAWAGPRGIEFDRSVDGGQTWGTDRIISDMPGGWDFPVSGIYRVNGLPMTRCDLSIGPYSGRVYVLWSDQRNGDTDVFLIHSDDQGAHWSPRVRVNGDGVGNGRDQFFPWMDVDPLTGRVYVVFYDRRATVGVHTEVWLATSTDGGETFAEEPISESAFTPSESIFFGDYIGISAHNGRVRPFWMRLDGNQLSVWTALIEQNPADTVLIDGRGRLVVVPNPARTTAHFYAGGAGPSAGGEVRIFGAGGRLLRSLTAPPSPKAGRLASWDLADESGRKVPAGVYLARGPDGASARLVVTR